MTEEVKYFKELVKPIIFIGNPRSGTSVISEIVMRNKVIGFPSQYQNRTLKNTNINYLRRLIDNRFWRIHGQNKQLNKVDFISEYTFRTGENYPVWEAITEDAINFGRGFLLGTVPSPINIDYIRSYFSKIVRKQGKKRLAFKITGPARIEYLSSIFPDAQFIYIKRSPIPTISSLLKVSFWKYLGYHRLWWLGAYSKEEILWAENHKEDPVAITAFQIKKVIEMTELEITKMKVDVLNIQYSDFVSHPERIISEILEYTNLPNDRACFDYFKRNKIFNQNKKDEFYFSPDDLKTIRDIFSYEKIT